MNQEIQSDSSYMSADLHFEVINSKLDRLMQIVTLTEKKPSVQMQDLLQLNDKEDEMILHQKQVNLELQNIVNEQDAQIKAYRNQTLKISNQFEKEFTSLQDFYFKENRKLNEMVEYLAKENLKIREQFCEQAKNYYKLLDFIKIFTQGQLKEQARAQLEQLGVQTSDLNQDNSFLEEQDEKTKTQNKINALEKFLIQILNTHSNNNYKEELLNLKNQLEQKMIEMVDLNQQILVLNRENENQKRQIKKANLNQNNSNNSKKINGQNKQKNSQKKSSKVRQTRGKKINFQEFLKDFEDQFNDISYESSSLSPSNQNSKNIEEKDSFQKNQNQKNMLNEDDSLSEIHENNFEEEQTKKNKNQMNLKKQNNKNSNAATSEDEYDSEMDDASNDSFIDDDEMDANSKKNRKLLKYSQKNDKNQPKNKKKGNQNHKENNESDFEESMSEEYSSDQYSSNESEDSTKKKKKKIKTNNNKQESNKQQPQKQPKAIPEKKRIVTQNKKKTSKKLLRRDLESQDRQFNQIDMILNMQN